MFHKDGHKSTDHGMNPQSPVGIACEEYCAQVCKPDGPDLAGSWEAFHQQVELKPGDSRNEYTGYWGVNRLRFSIDGHSLVNVKLGDVELLFGGNVSHDCSTIEWGNGQIWVRV